MFEIDMPIKKLTPTAKLPTQGSPYSAGYDIYADEQVSIEPHTTKKVSTGLATAIDDAFWIGLFARSGLATKEGLRPANCVGIIDPDYRGAIIMAVHNDTDTVKTIHIGDRIGQLVIMPRYVANIYSIDYLPESDRGEGGFGSTGK